MHQPPLPPPTRQERLVNAYVSGEIDVAAFVERIGDLYASGQQDEAPPIIAPPKPDDALRSVIVR